MKQTLLFFAFLLTISSALKAQPVPHVLDGHPNDSAVFSFQLQDSLNWKNTNYWVTIDTTNTALWDIGITPKSFFAGGTGATRAIMTDTVNPYPINANDWFVLKLKNGNNTIVTFDHKYETTAGHDGGIVEFSKNNGVDWENVKGDCNVDNGWYQGILTTNFYDSTDTLNTGEMAFSGTSTGWLHSRLQFFWGFPLKTTGTGGQDCIDMPVIWLRFRFSSDDTVENKDGWIIDNMKVEYDKYTAIKDPVKDRLSVYPNPSSGIIHFPAIPNEDKYTIEINNMMGQTVIKTIYREDIDLRKQPRGIYMYKISDGEFVYTGKLQLQ